MEFTENAFIQKAKFLEPLFHFEIANVKVNDLKKILRTLKLQVSGNKLELQKRLYQHILQNDADDIIDAVVESDERIDRPLDAEAPNDQNRPKRATQPPIRMREAVNENNSGSEEENSDNQKEASDEAGQNADHNDDNIDLNSYSDDWPDEIDLPKKLADAILPKQWWESEDSKDDRLKIRERYSMVENIPRYPPTANKASFAGKKELREKDTFLYNVQQQILDLLRPMGFTSGYIAEKLGNDAEILSVWGDMFRMSRNLLSYINKERKATEVQAIAGVKPAFNKRKSPLITEADFNDLKKQVKFVKLVHGLNARGGGRTQNYKPRGRNGRPFYRGRGGYGYRGGRNLRYVSRDGNGNQRKSGTASRN